MSAGLLSAESAPISMVGDKKIDKHSTVKVMFLKVATTQGELLRVPRLLHLSTRFEFGRSASLWSTIGSKCLPAASFSKIGMARSKFDTQ
jgi:hypothetical protein